MILLNDAEVVVVVAFGVGLVLLYLIGHTIAYLLSNGEDSW